MIASPSAPTVMAHDMPPMLDDRDVEARFRVGMERVSSKEPDVAELIATVDYLADEIEQSSKAAVRSWGGKFLPSKLRRVACLRRISQELAASQTGRRA